MKVTGRTRARTPYTQQYIDRRGFAPMVGDLDDRLARLELAPRGIRREQSILNVDIVAGGPPGPPGGSFPHLVISPTHTDTGGSPFTGAVLTYNGTIWAPQAPTSGGSAIFGADVIVDAAYTGTAGATATTVNGHVVTLFATIDAALAYAVALPANAHVSFFFASGTYNEQVARTPAAGDTWDIHGAGSGSVRWTATGASQTLLNLGSFGGSVRIKDVGFYLGSGATCVGIEGSTGILNLESVHIDTGASTSIGIACGSNAYLGVKNLTCEGSGTGIADAATLQNLDVIGSFFTCGTGILYIGNHAQIIGSNFNCSTRDISISTSARLTCTGNSFRKGILCAGSSPTNVDISDNIFDVGSGETGIDFSGMSVNSQGFNITGNSFKGVSGTPAGIRLDAQMISGLVADNTFVGFDSGDEIIGTGGASLDVFHNISDAGVIPDQGNPVGHLGSTTSSVAQYVFAPDVGPGVDIATGDHQGSTYHSGPTAETATVLKSDCKTAPGTSITVTIEYGDTDDLDTVASWTTIATKAMAGKSDSQSTMTNASIPANRLIRFNVTAISGSAPKDQTVTLQVTRPLS